MNIQRMSKIAAPIFRAPALSKHLASFFGLWALLALAALPARAQVSPIQELASRLADSISSSHQKSVIVFDFVGPGDKFTALGTDLADQFSAALAQSATTFTVADRKEIVDTFQEKGKEFQALLDTDMALIIARNLDVQSVVFGRISMDENHLTVSVEARRSENDRRIKGMRLSMPLTEEMKKLSAEVTEDPLKNYPQGGKNGFSFATCLRCPNPQFPIETLAGRGRGTVILSVVIGADGHAHKILVLRGLPAGGTEAAIAAVQTWRFKPATGPDGKPTTVVMPIEITFQLD